MSERSLDAKFRAACTDAIRACKLDRYEIAAKISKLTGHETSKAMLDKYTSKSSRAHNMPACVAAALCVVTKNRRPLAILAAPSGGFVAGPEEAKQLELVRLRASKKALDAKIEQLEGKVGA